MEATFVVVGGGIAGVSCVETLAFLESDAKIVLVSESSLIKSVTNLQAVTRTLTKFDIEEKDAKYLSAAYPNVTVLHDTVASIDEQNNVVYTKSAVRIKYKYLCVCTGAKPNIIPQQATGGEYVLGIRDTDSVEKFVEKLSKSRKIIIVGNGGIASELAYKIENTEVHWVVKDKHITATFVDPGAAEFFQPCLKKIESESTPTVTKRMRYTQTSQESSGAALGPDWYQNLSISGTNTTALASCVHVHYKTGITSVFVTESNDFPITVLLTDGAKIDCDLVVSATGVVPYTEFADALELSSDGGIQVNERMQTSVANVFAAGDVCSPTWDCAKHWFPMKLWTQARQMGCYASKCMSAALQGETVLQDFCFEMFAHSTKLFGYKVVLLGLYNGQKLGRDYEILLRMTKGKEYVKFVLQDNKLQGAVLIGETDLEETCENLILNQLDLAPYGDDILNPDIDIEDYFD